MITYDEFSKLDLRIGRVLEVNPHPDAEKLYLLKVNIGASTISLVAGIRAFYAAPDLVGKLIVVLVNLEPRSLRGIVSEGMLLAAQSDGDVSVIVSDREATPGSKVK